MELKIGAVARESGLTAATLRYYEELGLIRPVRRTSGGFRLYDAECLARLHFASRAKGLGLSLVEVRDLLEAGNEGGAREQQRLRQLVESRLIQARRQRRELEQLECQLELLHDKLTNDPSCGCRHFGACGCEPVLSPSAEPEAVGSRER